MIKNKTAKAIGIVFFVFAIGLNVQYALANYNVTENPNGDIASTLLLTDTDDTSDGKITCYSTFDSGTTSFTNCNGCSLTSGANMRDRSTCK